MSDQYEHVRSLPFPALAAALGLDIQRFRRRKEDWQGYCPVHGSKTNNNCFAYHDSGKFHCFSCNAKGAGGIDLAMAVKNIGFQAAVELLGAAPVPTTTFSPKAVPEAVSGALEPLKKNSWIKFAKPCAWLTARCPDQAILKRFGCFYYENNARKSSVNGQVLIPIRDIEGVLYGYLARNIREVTQERPKYRFPTNLPKSRFLFGAAELKASGIGLPVKLLYLVESPWSVLHFASLNLPAVALYGWSVSAEQLALLQQLARGVVYLPDRNKYQESKAHTAELAAHLWLRFPPLPDQRQDPEELSLEEIQALTH